jgi:two-component system chemotaxis response regulator CheY
MIVDDALVIRVRNRNILKENGYEVIEASSGKEAIEQYQKNRPDAVLLDYNMPDIDGIHTLQALRQLDSEAKIGFVTSSGQHALVMQALKLGAKDFVLKPYEVDRLVQAVRRLTAP